MLPTYPKIVALFSNFEITRETTVTPFSSRSIPRGCMPRRGFGSLVLVCYKRPPPNPIVRSGFQHLLNGLPDLISAVDG